MSQIELTTCVFHISSVFLLYSAGQFSNKNDFQVIYEINYHCFLCFLQVLAHSLNFWFKYCCYLLLQILLSHRCCLHRPWDGVEMVMLVGGLPPCFNCRMTERIRLTSFVFFADFGLKSHSFAIRSHSVPGASGCWIPEILGMFVMLTLIM